MLSDNYIIDIHRVSQITMVPTMLEVICKTTGMGFAAIARVTEDSWIACSVRDEIDFGLKPGGELKLETTICHEIRQNKSPVVIDHVSQNEQFANHHTPRMYGFQSYISVPIIRKNGDMFGTLCAIDPRPALLENNHIPGMFKMFADMIAFHLENIERVEASEREIAELGKELKITREENKQYRFISNHNLQEPLRKLRVFSSMLIRSAEKSETEKVKNFASKIRSNAQQFSMMIKDLSEFSNLNENQETFESVDLKKVVAEVCEQLSQQINFKDAKITTGALPVINGITLQLEQLFYHLISNALKFSKNDVAPLVSITCRESKLPGTQHPANLPVASSYFEIVIADNGIGIQENQLDKIFGIFSKLEHDPEAKGGGVGLAYCRKIVRNHGGMITAESQPGDGSAFTIYFPITGTAKL